MSKTIYYDTFDGKPVKNKMKNHTKIGGFGFQKWGVGGFRGVVFDPPMGGWGDPRHKPGNNLSVKKAST